MFRSLLVASGVLLVSTWVWCEDWPQFRGVNSSGRAVGGAYPTEVGPKSNVIWKTAIPAGHSSPAIHGNRIYLTGVRNKKQLVTFALDRTSGKILWEAEAPYEKLETVHRVGSQAQPSPATDGERVVSFFGSCGLFCYDRVGKKLWSIPFGPFKNDFGAGSSPVIVGNRVILCQDHDEGSFLLAVDKVTGKTLWKTDRSEFPRNYCTPVAWEVDGKQQIVVAGTLRIIGYDLETGKELWTVRGLSRMVCTTPIIDGKDNLVIAGWSQGGDVGGQKIVVDPFDVALAKFDKDKNGTLEDSELPKGGPIQQRFQQVDRDKDGRITKSEYEYFRSLFDQGRNVVLCIKPGGKGDVTESHILWEQTKQVPFCASPVAHGGTVFTIKDGGILSSIDAISGKPVKQARVDASGNYYASPVIGDGKMYLVDETGKLSVVSTDAAWKVIHQADFEQKVYATPALVEGRIYLRCHENLYCFGTNP